MKYIKPFATRGDIPASFNGVRAEDSRGGWWVLGWQSTPAGSEVYSIGLDTETGRPWSLAGWPKTLKERHVLAMPDDGGSKCICIRSK